MQFAMPSLAIALVLLVLLRGDSAYSGGPPTSVCGTLLPGHPGSPASGNGGYLITTNIPPNAARTGYQYATDTQYTVTLAGMVNTFRGFALQSVSIVDGSALGKFIPTINQQLLGCSPPNYTIVHNNPSRLDYAAQSFTWQAPSTPGVVDFLYTVVRYRMDTGEYYVRKSAIRENPDAGLLDIPPNPLVSTTLFDEVSPGEDLPENVTTPTTSPYDLPLIFKNPSSCNVSDCSIYVGIERNAGNDDYLNFYIEGKASAWVAVGFTATPSMLSADVLACNHNPSGDVEVLSTWNADNGRGNNPDKNMSTFAFSTSVEDGRIKCRFGRSITGSDDPHDLDLNSKHYVLFGWSNNKPDAGRLTPHTVGGAPDPSISKHRVNVAKDTGVEHGRDFDSIKRILIRTHGILMLIAWLLLASTGIFFAAHMRPALPNGEWFQVHRAFMIASLFIAMAGFILIFISQLQKQPHGLVQLGSQYKIRTAHFSIGIFVMLLQIVNPIIAIFRCHPGDKYRWIFNIIHGFPGIGTIAMIGALTNSGLGLSIFSDKEYSRFDNNTLLWILISCIVFIVLMNAALSGLKVYLKQRDKQVGMSLVNANKSEKEPILEKRSGEKETPSPESPLLWLGLAVYCTVTLLLIVVLAILVALPRA